MSTKSTIVYDETFHFYHKLGDTHHVYLELRGTHFEAHYNRVLVPIPIHIWEVIRAEGGVDLSLADRVMTSQEKAPSIANLASTTVPEQEKFRPACYLL